MSHNDRDNNTTSHEQNVKKVFVEPKLEYKAPRLHKQGDVKTVVLQFGQFSNGINL